MPPGIMKRTAAAQCPHLGSATDPFSRDAHANDAHRCYAQLVGERVDLSHQRRFCLSSAHARCPFLEVCALGKQRDWQAQAGAWWRTVSPAHRAPTAAQLGEAAGLGAAAARTWLGSLAMTTLQTWRTVHPSVVEPTTPPAAEEDDTLTAANAAVVRSSEALTLVSMAACGVAPSAHASDMLSVSDSALVDTHQGLDPSSIAHGAEPSIHDSDLPMPVAAHHLQASVHNTDLLMPFEPRRLPAGAHDSETPSEACVDASCSVDASSSLVHDSGMRTPLEAGEDAREWFWRAKNAETIDDVVECLERAHQLDPGNDMIASNLDWARQRAEAKRAAAKRKTQRAETDAATAPATIWTRQHRPPNTALRALGTLMDLLRAGLALAAYAMGGALVLAALPDQLREDLSSMLGIPWILSQIGAPAVSLPDASRLTSLVHVPLGDGYDLGLALPYALGFLAMFIGMGLMRREPSPSTPR